MTDPYSVLGLTASATDAQVKAAYRALARRNHPDNYQSERDKANAEERMKQINEAYHTIRLMRTGKASQEGDTQGGDARFTRIRAMIKAERFDEAQQALDALDADARGGEWNFLRGCVLVGKGWYFDAQKHLEAACYMDPENAEYRELLHSIRKASGSGRSYRSAAPGAKSDFCETCLTLACLDCFCDCCGEELCRC